jgi:hypothetical protein
MDEKNLSFYNFLKLVAQEQLPQKNHVPWGVKGISCLGRKGLSCPVDMVVPQGNLNPLFPKG